MLYNKKGELTTTQLVTLIILIISFVVILFLIFQLNLGETSKADVCRNSVVLKSKAVLDTPLNCRTSYVCFSKTNKCDKLVQPDEIIEVENEQEVYKELANKMADCWAMFGEGKVDYVGKDLAPGVYCSICSQVYFDSSIKEIFNAEAFSQEKIYDYIATHNISQGIGYDTSIYGEDFKDGADVLSKLDTDKETKFLDVDLSKPYIILMGINSKLNIIGWVGIAAATAGIAFISIPALATAVGVALLVGGTGTYFVSLVVKGASGNEYLTPTIIGKDSEEFSKLECKEVVTLP